MKKILFVALVAIAFASCGKDESNIFKINPLQTFSISPKVGAWKVKGLVVSTVSTMSALDIVKQTTVIRYTYDGTEWNRGFDPLQKDTISSIPHLSLWATDIIDANGKFVKDFIESKDCVLEHWENPNSAWSKKDTIGYVNNTTLRAAEIIIKDAYQKNDTATVRLAFKTAFTFEPITGKEYRDLKSKNLQ